jgi:hypothetical protein
MGQLALRLSIKVGKVNVAAPEPGKYDQDYFVSFGEDTEEWIDGVAVNNNPRRVRQFVAHPLSSG